MTQIRVISYVGLRGPGVKRGRLGDFGGAFGRDFFNVIHGFAGADEHLVLADRGFFLEVVRGEVLDAQFRSALFFLDGFEFALGGLNKRFAFLVLGETDAEIPFFGVDRREEARE